MSAKTINDAIELYETGKYIEAISLLEILIRENPEQEQNYWVAGRCCEELDYETKAIYYYKTGLKLVSDTSIRSDYYLNMGNSYLRLSKLDEAEFCFDKASEYEGNILLAIHNKALIYMCKKDYKRALELFQYVSLNGLTNKRINQHMEYCWSKLKCS